MRGPQVRFCERRGGATRRAYSTAAAKAGGDLGPALRPDPEVVAKPKRRTYTAEYKQRILHEAEVVATTRGGLGTLLRREGLYSSLLTYWRRERAQGILEALTPTETRAEVQAQPDGRRSPETSPTKRPLDRRSA